MTDVNLTFNFTHGKGPFTRCDNNSDCDKIVSRVITRPDIHANPFESFLK